MGEIPWRCSTCGHETMVDFNALSVWPIDRIRSARGYTCSGCGKREVILYTDASLEASLRQLLRYPPGHKKFQNMMAKCVRKAESLRRRGESDGTIRRKDMALA